MFIVGLVLIVIAVLLLVIGLFTANDGTIHDPTASLLGLHVGATPIFVLGFVSGVILLFGLSVTKWGGKRGIKGMQERRRMKKLAKGIANAQGKEAVEDDD